MDIREILGQLAEADADEVAAALKEKLQPVYQTIFNRGHSTATERASTREESLNELLNAEREKRQKLEREIDELRDKTPDAQEQRKQYEARIAELEDEMKALKESSKERVRNVIKRGAVADLQATLVSMGVDPDYAEVLVSKPGTQARIAVNGDDEGEQFEIAVMQEGREIPIQTDNPIKAYAEELRKSVPSKFIVSTADRGGETGGGGAGGSRSTFDRIREEARKRSEAGAGDRKSAAERMGLGAAR